MHSHTGKKDTIFHFNGDLSGDVIISRPVPKDGVRTVKGIDGEMHVHLDVPFDDIRELVAEYVLRERVRTLENASDKQILGLVD